MEPQVARIELLAEVDCLVGDLEAWGEGGPDWPPGRHCRALVRRLADAAGAIKVRLAAPLVVATLGGTGTGKSTLVNALVGEEVAHEGRERPTTRRPMLIARPAISPESLGIDPSEVEVVHRDLPILRDLVLIDCPDPDTTEADRSAGTNLARLRNLLPHCDVLLIAGTQQKYRSARVADELAAAATGARLIFVQTHADTDSDIRDDWRRMLGDDYATGEVFFVDSRQSLADAQAGIEPRGDFGRLVDLLTRELAGASAHRIRRANFLDLTEQMLAACRIRLEAARPAIEQLRTAIEEERSRLTSRLAAEMRKELSQSRGAWEGRLVAEIAGRWGFSPFSCVLRLFQGMGGIVSGAALMRVRTPAQLALWGAFEAGRTVQRRRKRQTADAAPERAVAFGWDRTELRTAAIVIEGYAAEAGFSTGDADPAAVAAEAQRSGSEFVARAAGEIQVSISRLADRHSGWFVRWRYECLLAVMLVLLFFRLGKNYFYDSWLAPLIWDSQPAAEVLGFDFFAATAFWLIVWCGLLLWAFSSRLRRGLSTEIDGLGQRWQGPGLAGEIFAGLEAQCQAAERQRHGLERLEQRVGQLQRKLATDNEPLGHILRRAG